MTVTLNLRPDTQAGLLSLAHKRGVSVEEYLRAMVEDTVLSGASRVLAPEDKVALWRQTARSFSHTPALSDEATSRDSMYADRG